MKISMDMYRSGEQQELERQINIYKSVRRRRPINIPPIVGYKKLPAIYNHTSLVGRRVQAGTLTERSPDDKPRTLLIDTPKDSFVIARQALWSYQTKNRGTYHVRPLSGNLPPIPYRFKPEEATTKSMKEFLTTSQETKDSELRKQRPCWDMSKRRKDIECPGSDGNSAFSDSGESTQFDNVHTLAVRLGECSAGNRDKDMDVEKTEAAMAIEAENQFDTNPYDEALKTKTKQDIYDTYIVGVPREGVSPIMYDDVIHGNFLLGRNQNVIDKSTYGNFARTTLPRRVPSLDISKMHAPPSTPPKNVRLTKKSSFYTVPPLTDARLSNVGRPAKPNSNCYPVFSQHPHDAPVRKLGGVKARPKLSKLKISLSQNKGGRRNSKGGGDSQSGDDVTKDMSRPLSPDPGSEHSVEINHLQIQSENIESDKELPKTDAVRRESYLSPTERFEMEREPSNTRSLRSDDHDTASDELTEGMLSGGESRVEDSPDTSPESSSDVIMVTVSKK